jgi:hypothetical protein
VKKLLIFVILMLLVCTAGFKYPTILDEVGKEDAYPGANALIVFDSTDIYLNRDGTNRIRYHRLIKVFNSLGRKQYGEATFSYLTLYDTVKVIQAHVITPDKKIIKIPDDAITDMPMPAWEGSKFYIPNLRFLKITAPGLEDGGAVQGIVESITHNAAFDSTFDWWELFEATEPVKEKVVRLFLPAGMDLKYKVENGEVTHYEVFSGDKKVHIWKKENVAKVVMEPAMPPLSNVVTKLLITCTDSWQDYSRWYYEISEPKLIADAALTEKVNDLIVDAHTTDDTIRALYEFVNKEIRYVETELIGKKGGYEPAPVGFTFKNKYGVCRDKAALLVAMLRTAGIKNTYMVLTNPIMLDMDMDIPVASQFNHAIVAVATDTGYLYLDPTAEGSVEYLVPFEDDKPVLVSTKKGEKLSRTPVRPPEINMIDVRVTGKLHNDLTLNEVMIMKAGGMIDNQFRRMCQMLPEEQLKQVFLQGIKQSFPKAKIDSFTATDHKDFTTPMELKIYVTIPEYVLKIGKEWHITTARSSELSFGSRGMWNLKERKYPLYLYIRMATQAASALEFPRGLKVKSLPDDYSYEDDTFLANISYSYKKNRINSQYRMVFKEPKFSPDQYLKIKNCMEKLEEYQGQEIILEE